MLKKSIKKSLLLIMLPVTILSATAYGFEESSSESSGCADYFNVKIFGITILRKYTTDCRSNPDGRWDWFHLSTPN